MLDIDVLPLVMRYVAATSTSRGAQTACDGVSEPFDGRELAGRVCGLPPGSSLAVIVAACDPVAVAKALPRRGALLVGRSGRLAVSVGAGKVVEPAGRLYALTVTDADWWVSAYWPRSVVGTGWLDTVDVVVESGSAVGRAEIRFMGTAALAGRLSVSEAHAYAGSQSRSAALTGVMSTVAWSTVPVRLPGALAGIGVISATGLRASGVGAQVAGVLGVTSAGATSGGRTVVVQGWGAIISSAVVAGERSAGLSGVGMAAAAGAVGRQAAATALTGTGATTAVGAVSATVGYSGTAALPGTGASTATGAVASTVVLRAMGTATGDVTVTTVNPVVPAGGDAGDLAILAVVMKPYSSTITTPSGWTKIGEGTNGVVASGADVGSVKVAVFVQQSAVEGAIGNLTISGADSVQAAINVYHSGRGGWDYSVFTTGGDTTQGTAYSAPAAGGMAMTVGDLLLAVTAVNTDNGSRSATSFTNTTGATQFQHTGRQSTGTTMGNDIGLYWRDVGFSAGSTALAPAFSFTNTVACSGETLFLRLRSVIGAATFDSGVTFDSGTTYGS